MQDRARERKPHRWCAAAILPEFRGWLFFGAIRPEEPIDLAVFHVEIYAANRLEITVGFVKILYRDATGSSHSVYGSDSPRVRSSKVSRVRATKTRRPSIKSSHGRGREL